MTLTEIADELKAQARAQPNHAQRWVLAHGLYLSLMLEVDHWRFTCFRINQYPSPREVETCLRDFGAPAHLSATDGQDLGQASEFRGWRYFWPAIEQPSLLDSARDGPKEGTP